MVNGLDFALVLLVLGSVAFGVWIKARRVAVGAPEARFGELRRRLGALGRAVVGHRDVLRERPEGLYHLCLFASVEFLDHTVVQRQRTAFRCPDLP